MFSKLKKPPSFFPILVMALLLACWSAIAMWQPLASLTVYAKSDTATQGNKKISTDHPAAQTIAGIQSIATRKAVIDVSKLPADTGTMRSPSDVTESKRTVEGRTLGPKPYDLPVPSNVIENQKRERSELASKVGVSDLTTLSPSESFSGPLDNNFVIPPDPHGAVGPNHLLTVLNSVLTIRNLQTSNEITFRLIDFWRGVNSLDDAGSPRALYDAFQQRWILTAAANEGFPDSGLVIAVSQTNDPTGLWNIYRIDADPDQQLLADFPSTGFNKNWIVIQANMFSLTSLDFVKSNLYVFDKADLYAGGTGKHSVMSLDGLGANQAPAITYDSQIDTMYLLQNWNGNQSGQGVLRVYSITGSVGSETLTAGNFIFDSRTWDSHPPGFEDFAPQLGLTAKIQTNDAAFASVFFRNGSIWAAHTVFLPAGGSPTHTAIQWWQLSPDGMVKQTNRIEDPSGQIFYAFPSLAVNKLEDVLLGYSRFSATQYAGANYAFRRASDPLNTFRADTVLKDGEGPYFKTYGSGQNRWGDYSATMVDPSNDVDLWTIQEAAYTQNQWRTWWGHFSPIVPNPTSDFGITIQSAVSQTAAGGQVSYSVKPINLGPDTAPDASFSFTIPTNTTFASVDDGGWNCVTPAVGGKGTVACSTGAFPKFRKLIIGITVSVDLSATGTIAASATINSSSADPNTGNNTSTASIPVDSNIVLVPNFAPDVTIAAGSEFPISLTVGSVGNGGLQGMPVSYNLAFVPDSGSSSSVADARSIKHQSNLNGFSSLVNADNTGAIRGQTNLLHSANLTVPTSGPSLSSTLVYTGIFGQALSTLTVGNVPGTATVTISVPGATFLIVVFKIVAGIDLQVTTRHVGNFKAGVRSEVLVTITNVGPLPYFGGYEIDDSFPEGFQEDIPQPNGNCTGGANHIQCFLFGPGPPGTSSTFAFQVIPSVTGTFTNTVTLKLTSDANATNNTATDSIAVESGSYDLSITETHSEFKLSRAATIDYKITNLGNAATSGLITVHNDENFGALRFNGTEDPGWTCADTSDYACSYDGTIVAGQTLHLILPVSIGGFQSDGTMHLKGTLNNVGDSNANNNIAAENVPVIQVSTDLSVRPSNLPATASVGQTLTLIYVVENLGPEEADFVTFNDTLPSNMSLTSVTPEFGNCVFSGPIIQCSLGIVPLNKQETVRVVVKLTGSGDAIQHVFLTSEVNDPNTTNSSILPKITVNNPTPLVSSLSPNQIPAMSPDTVVTITGSGFLNGAVVKWNGANRATTFINDTKVSAVIMAADLSQAGDASVTVSNPQPTGGPSNAVSLTITKLTATLVLSNLQQAYNGTAKSVTAETVPAGITGIAITYNGTSVSPIDAGSYSIVASITNPNYIAADATGTLVIDKATQSINFPQVSDKTFYDSPFQLNASTTSGLPLSYEGSGGVSISGNTATITGTGSATITASQPGNNNYNAAQSVSRTFNINNPLPQILRLNPGAIIAGSGQTTLKVAGSNFVTDSLVKIDGVNSPATFVNRIELDIPLSAADLASPGTKTITIANPAPGGGNSIPVTLKVISITNSDTRNIQSGTTDTVSNAPTQSGDAGITAQLHHSQSAGGPATVTVQQYSADPFGGSGLIDVGGGYVDLKVTGADPNDTLNATFYYGSNVTGANEDKLQLLYFTGTKWAKVRSSSNMDPIKNTSDNQDGTVSGGSFTVVFDETSSPKLSQFTGTIFSSTPGLYGDLNNDQVINVVDLILMANFLAGNTTVDKTAGDLNLDNKLNVSDLIALANFLAGNISHLPISTSP